MPELFYQLYFIYARVGERIIPCVYAMLPNKTQATYERLLRELLVIENQIRPTSVMMDFEKSAMNTYATAFAGVNVQACLYHLSQNIYRHLQSLGLQERYQSDAEFDCKCEW